MAIIKQTVLIGTLAITLLGHSFETFDMPTKIKTKMHFLGHVDKKIAIEEIARTEEQIEILLSKPIKLPKSPIIFGKWVDSLISKDSIEFIRIKGTF